MNNDQQTTKASFFGLNTEKIAIFTIISTFIPIYIYAMLCGGYQPIFLFIFDPIMSGYLGNLIYILPFAIPGLIFNYSIACLVYKTILFFNKKNSKNINWIIITVLLVFSILIYYFSLGVQGISC